MLLGNSVRNKKRIRRAQKDFQWVVNLTAYEELALSLIGDIDIYKASPRLINCDTDLQKYSLWNYYRVVLSSANQGEAYTMGRRQSWMLMDDTSKKVMGIWATADTQSLPKKVTARVGVKVGEIYESSGARSLPNITMLKRCLPIAEYGKITGGKAITSLSLSKEVLRFYELKYGNEIALVLIKTLHGKSSQYNRMKNVEYLGTEEDGRGSYIVETRAKAIQYLAGEVSRMGKSKLLTVDQAWNYWKERWLPNKAGLLDNGILRVDKTPFILSERLQELRERQINCILREA